MPYKRPGSPFWQVRRRKLPAFGDTGQLSSKSKRHATAARMERLLEEIADRALVEPSWRDLLEAVRAKTVDLPTLLQAKTTGTLDRLRRGLTDPLLSEALQRLSDRPDTKRGVRIGIEMLRPLCPSTARLSWLSAQTITRLCLEAEAEGRKRNSVRRTMLRAISKMLTHELGRSERNRIFADVQFSGASDTREVHLTPEQIRALLGACEQQRPELRVVVALALATSADRGDLLAGKRAAGTARGLRVSDVRIYQEAGVYDGTLYLPDAAAKSSARVRTVPLDDSLCRMLLPYVQGKGAEATVFDMTYTQLDFVWKRARAAAGLPHVRFKDLRAQVAIYGEEAGVPLTVMSRTMGHADEAMTRRYQQRQAAMSSEQMSTLRKAMGL